VRRPASIQTNSGLLRKIQVYPKDLVEIRRMEDNALEPRATKGDLVTG
jgi:hypothetical protein